MREAKRAALFAPTIFRGHSSASQSGCVTSIRSEVRIFLPSPFAPTERGGETTCISPGRPPDSSRDATARDPFLTPSKKHCQRCIRSVSEPARRNFGWGLHGLKNFQSRPRVVAVVLDGSRVPASAVEPALRQVSYARRAQGSTGGCDHSRPASIKVMQRTFNPWNRERYPGGPPSFALSQPWTGSERVMPSVASGEGGPQPSGSELRMAGQDFSGSSNSRISPFESEDDGAIPIPAANVLQAVSSKSERQLYLLRTLESYQHGLPFHYRAFLA